MRGKPLAILGLVLVAGLVIALVVINVLNRQETPAAPATTDATTPAPQATEPDTPSAPPTGTSTPTVAPREAGMAVSEFVAAWLETDPEARVTALEATAIPHLAELLANTDPFRIPDTEADGVPQRITLPAGDGPEHSPDAQRWEQHLTDGTTVWIDIIPDPQRGWLAAAIQPAR